jgi:SAM-dependent methyltransferase
MSSLAEGGAAPAEEALDATGSPVSRSERAERALAAINLSGVGLEIGPSYDPLLPKASGARVEIVDHLPTGDLVKKYQKWGLAPDKIAAIEEVDHIWSGGRLTDVLGRPGEYDFIIAAHLIEHVVDLIGFLQDCQELLGTNGRLALVVPDQRFCFDFFKSATSVGPVVDAHLKPTRFHSPGTLLEHGLYDCATDGHSAWARGQVGPITFIHKNLDYARSALEKGVAQQEYVDAHHWKFTPASFSLLIQDLRDLGYHSFVEVASHPTVGFEFYATLSLGEREEGNRKDRIALLTQARAEQVEVSPTHVKLRADLDDVERVSGLPIAALSSHLQAMNQRAAEAEARVKLAETQIAQLKTSTSWRVTRPLRGLADLARKLR